MSHGCPQGPFPSWAPWGHRGLPSLGSGRDGGKRCAALRTPPLGILGVGWGAGTCGIEWTPTLLLARAKGGVSPWELTPRGHRGAQAWPDLCPPVSPGEWDVTPTSPWPGGPPAHGGWMERASTVAKRRGWWFWGAHCHGRVGWCSTKDWGGPEMLPTRSPHGTLLLPPLPSGLQMLPVVGAGSPTTRGISCLAPGVPCQPPGSLGPVPTSPMACGCSAGPCSVCVCTCMCPTAGAHVCMCKNTCVCVRACRLGTLYAACGARKGQGSSGSGVTQAERESSSPVLGTCRQHQNHTPSRPASGRDGG